MPRYPRCKKRTATDVLHAEATDIRPTHRSICHALSQIPSNCESGKRQHPQCEQTDEGDIKVGGSKQARKEAHVRTGLFKECRKHTRLEQQRHYGNQQHTDGIDETLRHHRTQRFGERNPVVLRQDTAAGNLPHTRYDQIGRVRHKTAYTLFDTLGYSPNGANVRFQRQPRNRCPSTPNTSEKAIQP